MKNLTAFLSGLLFSIGLIISGMTQPANIIGFLDIFGEWKPALLFVMVGAVGVYALLSCWVLKRNAPLFDGRFTLSEKRKIDAPLIIGAVTFGLGWGLGGLCPGPALVAVGFGAKEASLFFVAMLAGILLYKISSRPDKSSNDTCG